MYIIFSINLFYLFILFINFIIFNKFIPFIIFSIFIYMSCCGSLYYTILYISECIMYVIPILKVLYWSWYWHRRFDTKCNNALHHALSPDTYQLGNSYTMYRDCLAIYIYISLRPASMVKPTPPPPSMAFAEQWLLALDWDIITTALSCNTSMLLATLLIYIGCLPPVLIYLLATRVERVNLHDEK